MRPLLGEVDVLIAGTGMGGATLGHALAKSGLSVLFLERGRDHLSPGAIRGLPAEASPGFASDPIETLTRAGRCAEHFSDGLRHDTFIPYVGSGTGGSSSLYGMVLERLFPADMESWPLSYDELAPWYREAEALYGVSGTPDPLRLAAPEPLRSRPPLSEANLVLFGHLRARGLNPYRLHMASPREPDCGLCQGFLCGAESCKADAATVCLRPALALPSVHLLTEARVTRLESQGRRVAAVHAVVAGEPAAFRARIVVLAAGALATPVILRRSGNLANRSGLVGRRLMRHLVDLYVLTLAPRFRHRRESKEVGLNDFNCEGGPRLGTVQSFGMAPPYDYLRNRPGRNPWKLLGPRVGGAVARLFASAPIVAGILEDAPNPANGVELSGQGVQLRYRPASSDLKRRAMLRRRMERAFLRFGPIRVAGTSDRDAFGHACGTARMGDDPGCSVVDRFNRAHELDNLYIADSSFFPTSGGVNPSLTIAANALRLAHHLREVL